MGVDLRPLISVSPLSIANLRNKSIAVDALNTIFQFLAIIRGPTGEYLSNDKGEVTSHLSGIFYRNVNLLVEGVDVIYVFDGKPPDLKEKEIERRKQIRLEATVKYHEALKDGNLDDIRKYSQATSTLTKPMLDDAKRLLNLLGIPIIQAKSEGEALAAHLTRTDKVYAAASQDYDSLLFGCKRLVRNLAISGKRKLPHRNTYVDREPEFIELEQVLQQNQITHEQLIDIGILIGTDFNNGGFEGIGPKTALKLIKKYGKLQEIEKIKESLEQVPYREIKELFRNPEIPEISDSMLEQSVPQYENIIKFLCDEKSFSYERVNSMLERLKVSISKKNQSLEKWF
jgi:flap endonuclease-1